MMHRSILLLGALSACASAAAENRAAAPWRFDAAAVLAKLQGAWVMRDRVSLGSVEAWEVSGNRARIWDAAADAEIVATLDLETPCWLTVQHTIATGTESTYDHFVIDDTGTLHLGLGEAGLELGDKIVACMSNGVFVRDATGCTFYNKKLGPWEANPATCSLAAGTFKASTKVFDYSGKLAAHGTVFATDQLWRAPAPERVASYEAAKQTARARLATPLDRDMNGAPRTSAANPPVHDAKRVEIAAPCRGAQLDLTALATSKRCVVDAAHRPLPASIAMTIEPAPVVVPGGGTAAAAVVLTNTSRAEQELMLDTSCDKLATVTSRLVGADGKRVDLDGGVCGQGTGCGRQTVGIALAPGGTARLAFVVDGRNEHFDDRCTAHRIGRVAAGTYELDVSTSFGKLTGTAEVR